MAGIRVCLTGLTAGAGTLRLLGLGILVGLMMADNTTRTSTKCGVVPRDVPGDRANSCTF